MAPLSKLVGPSNLEITMKVIQINNDARIKLKRGVDTVADIVRNTLGPSGRNVIVGNKFGVPVITNDGISVAKAIELEDEIENLGVQVVREASQKTNDIAGDGTMTAMVLAQAILNEGFSRIDTKDSFIKTSIDPMKIKREINAACILVVEELKKQAKPIKTKKDIEKVAFISMENKEIGDIIANVVHTVGKDGVVKVEESDTLGIEASITEGMEIPNGYVSSHMATNDKLESIVEDAYVLVTNGKIESQDQIIPIAEKLNAIGIKELVIFAEGFDQMVINAFVLNRVRNTFRVLAVKPSIWNKGIFEDICTVTGAVLIDVNKSMSIVKAELITLAKVKKIIATSEKTTIIGGIADKKESLTKLRAELLISKSVFEKQKIEERIARVSGSVALIRVGAVTDTERKYLKDKIDDAVNATKCALSEGVVKGAGLALKEVSEKLAPNILSKAILAPYEQIQASTGGIEVGDDVIDPVKVTRTALETACSIAGILLTTECAIADKNEPDTK